MMRGVGASRRLHRKNAVRGSAHHWLTFMAHLMAVGTRVIGIRAFPGASYKGSWVDLDQAVSVVLSRFDILTGPSVVIS